MKISNTLILILFSFLGLFGQGDSIFNDSYVHEIRITSESENLWEMLSSDYELNYPDVPYQMVNVTIDDILVDSIGVRQKGFASHFSVLGAKKSIKLDFNEFVSGKKYDGLKKINLNNGAGDPAMQRDKLCYDIMNNAGVNAPRTSYAKVFINDIYWGLYVLVEQIDKTFLNDNFDNPEGNLYKNIGNSFLDWLGADTSEYQNIFELKTDHKEDAWTDFVDLMEIINETTDAEFAENIDDVFNVDLYLKTLTVDVATSNWDSYLEHGRNFYLYQDPENKKFNWMPWDYNFALGGTFPGDFGGGGGEVIDDPENCLTITNGTSPYPATDTIFQAVINQDAFCCNTDWDDFCQEIYDGIADGNGGAPGGGFTQPINLFTVDMSNSEKVLINRLLNIPSYKERYYRDFCQLLENNFTTDRIFPLIDKYGDLIREDIQADNNYLWPQEDFELDLDQGKESLPGLKKFFSAQVVTLAIELDQAYDCDNASSSLNALDVSINEFMASNDSISGLADGDGDYDDWIELYNNTDEEVDLSNAYLTDNADKPRKWSFPVGAKIPANGYVIVWADKDTGTSGYHANFKLAKAGGFIMLMDDNLVLDSLTYDEQETNITSARVPNGLGDFALQEPTFNQNNTGLTNTQDLGKSTVSVYPNPVNNYINIDFEYSGNRSINLSNGVGQSIVVQVLADQKNLVQLPNLRAGIYFLTVREGGKILATERITVFP